jgi:hypothetical protein
VPLIAACEIVTVPGPALVSVTVCDGVVPTVTLVKVTLVGFEPNCPCVLVIPDPVPMSVTLGSEFEPATVTFSVALNEPAALGVNSMLIGALCPAAIVAGSAGESREKYLVEIAALLMVTADELVLVAVTDSVLVLPASTVPKSRLVTLRVIPAWFEGPTLKPWQPTIIVIPARTVKTHNVLLTCFGRVPVSTAFVIVSHEAGTPTSMTVPERGTAQPHTVSTSPSCTARYLWYMALPPKGQGTVFATRNGRRLCPRFWPGSLAISLNLLIKIGLFRFAESDRNNRI